MVPPKSSLQQYKARVDMVSLWCVLALVSSLPLEVSGTSAGVKVRLAQNGIDYACYIGITVLQESLKSIKVPDQTGTEDVFLIGKASYSLTGIQVLNLGLPEFSISLVSGTGVKLSISNAYINLYGYWRVNHNFMRDSGSFDVTVSSVSISSTIAAKSNDLGHPTISIFNCSASVGQAGIEFHGGASWLYNLFSDFIGLRADLQKQICPLFAKGIDELNHQLKTLNVQLEQVFPLPAFGNMNLLNIQFQVLNAGTNYAARIDL